MKGLSHALRGLSGEYETNRVVGFVGGMAYVFGAHAFVAWNMIEGRAFDLVAYCTAFPAGLGATVLAIGGAVAIKDRNVAKAKVIAETGTDPPR